jgi:hypothetical protein
MRWWSAGLVIAGLVVLAACGGSPGGASSARSSPGRSAEPSSGAPTHSSTTPVPAPSPTAPTGTGTPSGEPSPSAGSCAAGHAQVTVSPGDAPARRLCVRPGTVVSMVLAPRADDRRWTAVRSSAPVFVVASGWRVGPDGAAHATLRCAGTRGGSARITVLAKAPDVAGAARAAFTLDVSVVPYPKEG